MTEHQIPKQRNLSDLLASEQASYDARKLVIAEKIARLQLEEAQLDKNMGALVDVIMRHSGVETEIVNGQNEAAVYELPPSD